MTALISPPVQFATESISLSSAGWDAPLALTVRATQTALEAGYLATAVAALVFFVMLRWTRRRAPALRLALLVASAAFLFTAVSMRDVTATVATVDAKYAAFLIVVPLLSILAGIGGLLWIARRWRAVAANECMTCGHTLLASQTICPECGASSAPALDRTQTRRQRRVLAGTILAFLSAIVGFTSIGWIGNATLPWRVKMLVVTEDDAGAAIFVCLADGIVLARAAPRQAETEYGPRGGIRAVFNASIDELRNATGARASGVWSGIAVLPAHGVAADDAWFDGVTRSLEGRPPAFARAGLSWARTVSKRLGGDVAHFDGSIAGVYSVASLQRPAAWWAMVAPLVGPGAACVLALAFMLSRRCLSRPPA